MLLLTGSYDIPRITGNDTVAISDSSQLILGIESSCDDTGVAIVSADGEIIGEGLAQQNDIHAPYGGVVPDLARQAHEEAIDDLVERVVCESGVSPADLSAVAVTIGPGLSLCLKVWTIFNILGHEAANT